MDGAPLPLLVLVAADGSETLACPTPGRVRIAAREGESLVAGSTLGVLQRGGRRFTLVLPDGVHGQLRQIVVAAGEVAVEYGTPLAVLGAVEAAAVGAPRDASEGRGRTWSLTAPSDGTFYLRPSPDQPPYVEAGATIERGTVVGLIEVMKCFSPIGFDPPTGIERGVVGRILVGQASEVRAGQPLFEVRLG